MPASAPVIGQGRIEIYMGCMFSSKTTELIRHAKIYKCMGKSILVINHAFDDRYTDDDVLMTHDKSAFPCKRTKTLIDIDTTGLDAIFVNEGQFFPDLVEACSLWADKKNIHVFVCGLDGDSKRGVFGSLLSLIPIADNIHKLHACCMMCKDGTLAPFTHRLTTEADQISIGSDNYIAVCRKHYLDLSK